MAAAFARQYEQVGLEVLSGGSEPGDIVNPVAVEVMNELGIDIASYVPQKFTDDMLRQVDVVVTMGCGDTCPYIAGKRYVDWPLQDPKGQPIEVVRSIRDDIHERVRELVAELFAHE
jgi:arsenate reductase